MRTTRWSAVWVAGCIAAAASAQECHVESGAERAALVELYTSEGCSSCPPADRQLSRLGAADTRVIPLAWHVDFWDAIGWKDPFAHAEFTARQRMLVAAGGGRALYTPHFFVNGREIRDRARLQGTAHAETMRPAAAQIELTAARSENGRLSVSARARTMPPRRGGSGAVLYAAVTENALENHIGAGENRGATLRHDYVVRNWLGPVAVEREMAVLAATIELSAEQRRKGVGVTAFLQDLRSGEVLQAVSSQSCSRV